MGSYSLDKEVLKKLGIGLTLAAAVLAFIVEKLFWQSSCVLEEDCEHGRGQWHQRSPNVFEVAEYSDQNCFL